MKEQTYSCVCPVHHQKIITNRTRIIREKSGKRYTKPYFFCSKCNAYYIIVDEFAPSFKQKSIADNGRLIYILGNQTGKNANSPEISNNKLKKLYIVPSGEKLPKKCIVCETKTKNFTYEVSKKASAKKLCLNGKSCPQCGVVFFPETIYEAHEKSFENVQVIRKEAPTTEEINTAESGIQSEASAKQKEQIPVNSNDQKACSNDEDTSLTSNENLVKDENIKEENSTEKVEDSTNSSMEKESVQKSEVNPWNDKKKRFEQSFNGPEAYFEAYQIKKCPVCGGMLAGDMELAWVKCDVCDSIYCEEDYKHIFSEPIIIIGKKK